MLLYLSLEVKEICCMNFGFSVANPPRPSIFPMSLSSNYTFFLFLLLIPHSLQLLIYILKIMH